ncbi:MAG: hypothetical protein J0H64_06040, partial [Actinobacteria bacterium]|nr:hypothetical protein [Actinomycetota bacterium]
ELPGVNRLFTASGDEKPSIAEFSAALDVLVCDPLDEHLALSTQQIWRAVARGTAVLMPQSYLGEFGDAVTPFEESDLPQTLGALVSDGQVRRAAVERAQSYLAANASAESLAGVLSRLGLR